MVLYTDCDDQFDPESTTATSKLGLEAFRITPSSLQGKYFYPGWALA